MKRSYLSWLKSFPKIATIALAAILLSLQACSDTPEGLLEDAEEAIVEHDTQALFSSTAKIFHDTTMSDQHKGKAHLIRSVYHFEQEQYQTALYHCTRALNYGAGNDSITINGTPYRAQDFRGTLLLRNATEALDTANYPEAEKHFRSATDYSSTRAEAVEGVIRTYIEWAESQASQASKDQFESAIRLAEYALQYNPKEEFEPQIRRLKVRMYDSLGQYGKAIQELSVLRKKYNDAWDVYSIARYLCRRSAFGKAIDLLYSIVDDDTYTELRATAGSDSYFENLMSVTRFQVWLQPSLLSDEPLTSKPISQSVYRDITNLIEVELGSSLSEFVGYILDNSSNSYYRRFHSGFGEVFHFLTFDDNDRLHKVEVCVFTTNGSSKSVFPQFLLRQSIINTISSSLNNATKTTSDVVEWRTLSGVDAKLEVDENGLISIEKNRVGLKETSVRIAEHTIGKSTLIFMKYLTSLLEEAQKDLALAGFIVEKSSISFSFVDPPSAQIVLLNTGPTGMEADLLEKYKIPSLDNSVFPTDPRTWLYSALKLLFQIRDAYIGNTSLKRIVLDIGKSPKVTFEL